MVKGRRLYCRIGVSLVVFGLLFAKESSCQENAISFQSEESKLEYRFTKTWLSIGATFYLKFASSHCEGDILFLKCRDNAENFYRFSLEKPGVLAFHFRSTDALFKVDIKPFEQESFCDGKVHHVELQRRKKSVVHKTDITDEVHQGLDLTTLNFGKPDKIILGAARLGGEKFSGIVYNATVGIIWWAVDKPMTNVSLVKKYFANDLNVKSTRIINTSADFTGNLQKACTNSTYLSLKDSSGIIAWGAVVARKALNRTFCSWAVSAPPGNRVRLKLLHFSTNNSRTCLDSYLEVFDGSHGDAPLLVRYCNPSPLKTKSGGDLGSRYSSGRHMRLQLVSGPEMGVEVMASYKAVGLDRGPCPTNARLDANHSGIITSPDFPYHYGDNRSCSWILTAPKGYHVLLTFDPHDFHVFSFSNSCECGHLEARGGNSVEGQLLGRYCGEFAPSPVYSGHRHMWLGFFSRSQWGNKGFRVTYSAVGSLKADCPRQGAKVHTTKHGNITSPRFPLHYPGNMECFWRIRVDQHHTIKLEFNTPFHLDPNCSDYVEIEDGGRSKKFCQSSLRPPPFYSRTNELLVLFHADGYRVSDAYGISGFSITYSALPRTYSGGSAAASSGVFISLELLSTLLLCYGLVPAE